MRLTLIAAILSSTLFGSAVAYAADDYRCSIEKVVPANPVHELVTRAYLGKTFTVERETGVMAGVIKNLFYTRPRVIDRGSSDNSFKVVTTMTREEGTGAGSAVYVLIVNEFEKGPKKSFVFLNNDLTYFGSCLHF